MAKAKKSYSCNQCGAITTKWSGKCESCGEWNCISEEIIEAAVPKGLSASHKGKKIEFSSLNDAQGRTIYPRFISGIAEFDRVTGGGLVPGSATLIGGDPGIGKSTLLLQAVAALSAPPTHLYDQTN